jgi:hypothetical protein
MKKEKSVSLCQGDERLIKLEVCDKCPIKEECLIYDVINDF